MTVVWIVENPASETSRMTSLLCGFVAVRAFATVRSMLRVASCEPLSPGGSPKIILLDREQVFVLQSSEAVISDIRLVLNRNGWGDVNLLVVDERREDLVDRVRHLISNASPAMAEVRQIHEGDLRVDLDAGKVICLACGQHDTLSPTETRLLRLLLEHRDRVISRAEVIAKVWNGTKIAPRSLDAHISRLRKRIGFTGVVLESAYGDGYRLSTGSGCEAASGRITTSQGGSTGIGRSAGRS